MDHPQPSAACHDAVEHSGRDCTGDSVIVNVKSNVVDTPVVVDASNVADNSIVNDAPAVSDTSLVVDTPIVVDPPSVADGPSVADNSFVDDAPIAADNSIVDDSLPIVADNSIVDDTLSIVVDVRNVGEVGAAASNGDDATVNGDTKSVGDANITGFDTIESKIASSPAKQQQQHQHHHVSGALPAALDRAFTRLIPGLRYVFLLTAGVLLLSLFADVLQLLLNTIGVDFPGSVAGLLLLFYSLCALERLGFSGSVDNFIALLDPGSSLLLGWMALLFVPAVVIMPIQAAALSLVDGLKISLIVLVGIPLSASTAGWSLIVLIALRDRFARPERAQPAVIAAATDENNVDDHDDDDDDDDENAFSSSSSALSSSSNTKANASSSTAASAASASSNLALHIVVIVVLLVLTVLLALVAPNPPIRCSILLISMFYMFWLARMFHAGLGPDVAAWKAALLHPVMVSIASTMLTVALLGAISSQGFIDSLKAFRTGNTISLASSGVVSGPVCAGDIVLYLLNPAVVAMAFPMYSVRLQFKARAIELLGAAFSASFVSIMSTAVAARLLGIGQHVSVSLVLRTVTTPIAIASSEYIGGDAALVGAISVLTGIIGALFWRVLMRMNRFETPAVRGTAVGACCHGIGTSTLLMEEPVSAPYASIAFSLVGICSAVLIAIPPIRSLVLLVL